MKKFQYSHTGMCLTAIALIGTYMPTVMNSIHGQSLQARIKSEGETKLEQYRLEVKSDLDDKAMWQTTRSGDQIIRVGDSFPVPSGTLGPKTVLVLPKPGQKNMYNQVARVDERDGKVLAVFSLEQINKEQK
jgi:hypothetical protein